MLKYRNLPVVFSTELPIVPTTETGHVENSLCYLSIEFLIEIYGVTNPGICFTNGLPIHNWSISEIFLTLILILI